MNPPEEERVFGDCAWPTPNRPSRKPRCILILSADAERRRAHQAAIERGGHQVYSVATVGDALVVVFAEGCDLVIADVTAGGVALHDAAGALAYLRSRHRADLRGIVLTDDALPAADLAMRAGFNLALGPLATPEVVADAVAELLNPPSWNARRDAHPSPAGVVMKCKRSGFFAPPLRRLASRVARELLDRLGRTAATPDICPECGAGGPRRPGRRVSVGRPCSGRA